MDTIVSLCKRRGFIFPSSEIYGGFGSTWDYGPVGSLLKNNVKAAWIKSVVQERDDMSLIDAAILMAPQVWRASGHLESFTDPLVDCLVCKLRFRADHVGGERCPACGGQLTEARQFNMMFKTFVGPVEEEAAIAYLRPETAQGIFVNFKNVMTTTRRKLPFGIAQVGKAFRNEITPGNFTFRTREFEQMEIEYFVRPGTDEEVHQQWVKDRLAWYERYGMRAENLQLREHAREELAHYAKATVDIEYRFPFGWAELEGIANRTDFDLRQHQQASGEDLTYFDEQTHERFLPYVIEPSAGADRATLAFLIDAYDEEPDKEGTRVVLRLHKDLAPFKVAFLPLSKKPDLVELAKKAQSLVRPIVMTTYDDTQSIGRRYRRQDEIGTPYCVTVDFQSLEDQAVTIRDRDTMSQVRVPIEELPGWFRDAFEPR
ncbi:MAG: glycine--tRNA ligase [Sphingomonadaceae bacterium]